MVKRPIVIDIIAFLAMFGLTVLVSIATKGRFGEDFSTNQRIANYCIISTVAIIIVAVNKFFIKYTIPVNSPINLSVDFAIVTAFASTINIPLTIGIVVAGVICFWVCVASDKEIVRKQLFLIDATVMYTLILCMLYYIPKNIGHWLTVVKGAS